MKNMIATAALVGIGFCFAGVPASAAPAPAAGLAHALGTPITEVQTSRMERRRMMRSNRVMRRMNKSRSSQAGNARDAKRPVRAQSQGGTTGGPRY
jgi:hypothetical protein